MWQRSIDGRGRDGYGSLGGGDIFSLTTSCLFLATSRLWLENSPFLLRVMFGGDVSLVMVLILCHLPTPVFWCVGSPKSQCTPVESVLLSIWCNRSPSKVIIFSWKLLPDRIPTRDNLLNRRVHLIPRTVPYPIC